VDLEPGIFGVVATTSRRVGTGSRVACAVSISGIQIVYGSTFVCRASMSTRARTTVRPLHHLAVRLEREGKPVPSGTEKGGHRLWCYESRSSTTVRLK
jgi:hypothetical protein